jgi:hypothetical protein
LDTVLSSERKTSSFNPQASGNVKSTKHQHPGAENSKFQHPSSRETPSSNHQATRQSANWSVEFGFSGAWLERFAIGWK